jgi:GNAT superfamily N-acetyltransferase
VIQELQAGATNLVYQAMLELRPKIGPESVFVEHVDTVQRLEGYRVIGLFVENDVQAVAAAAFRIMHMLAWGRTLYCDDLTTRPEHRGQGHAGKLMDWMIDEAKRLRCDQFHLDSGVGPDRTDAHRLYFNKRMRISAFHFLRPV